MPAVEYVAFFAFNVVPCHGRANLAVALGLASTNTLRLKAIHDRIEARLASGLHRLLQLCLS